MTQEKTRTAVLVDDELDAIEALTHSLNLYCPQVEVVATARSVEAGLREIEAHQPDLLFLDIQMPRNRGFDLLRLVKNPTFQTIFVSAHESHAVEAVKYHAMAYLLKPVGGVALVEAVALAEETISNQEQVDYSGLLDRIRQPRAKKIAIPTGTGQRYFDANEIIRVAAEKNYSNVYTTESPKPILVSRNLKHFETLFSEFGFLRVHKTHLVNAYHIREYSRRDGGVVTLSSGEDLLVSRHYRQAVTDYLKDNYAGA